MKGQQNGDVFTEFVSHDSIPAVVDGAAMAQATASPKKKLLTLEQEFNQLFGGDSGRDNKKISSFLRTCRMSPNEAIRSSLWQALCEGLDKSPGQMYQETVGEIFGHGAEKMVRSQSVVADKNSHHRMRRNQSYYGNWGSVSFSCPERHLDITLPAFVDHELTTHYFLNEQGLQCAKRIICVIAYTEPDITYSPALFPLTCLCLHYMAEEDAFNAIYGLLHSKMGHISQTKLAYQATGLVIRDLTKRFVKSAHSFIERNTKQVDVVFEGWLWWLLRDLPFSYMLRVIDCYLFEGRKVLYRAALAVLHLFQKHAARDGAISTSAAVQAAISQFCRDIKNIVTVEKFLKTAFGIRGLKRKDINKLYVKHDMFLKSKVHLRVGSSHGLVKAKSSESLGPMRANKSFIGPPMPIHEINSTILSHDEWLPCNRKLGRSRSVGRIALADAKTNVLTLEQLQTIWSWLPYRMTVYQPELLFSTEEHGTSLITLYQKIENKGAVILVIKTEKDEVFGAYCSNDWSERIQYEKRLTYFGTGETFLFTLVPEVEKIEWVGLKKPPEEISNTGYMFQAGDRTMLTIGGGDGEGIQLDENLFQGRTERCNTFENEPLCEDGDFHCKVVEVFGFS
ncbi:TBC1 domain family member 24 isoform X1 [Lingula anatina]|uniref:TBC1 domain family member 24 isoform X1 n=1 Tax=Lingula anatina TaxID=7574 RepID=A0A1S3JT24_LINAN|nr:TBC1 domain family member 24-like isoform X1 [Lingula anatina]XP_013413477.1 TBC1 domain family member 24 isoform X1 [Lingula anatina]|eukprot:XP_013388368.1 TBC1 domain family member 24-like isoform X1 [Lingula anatina]